jgi:hypothetical protein
MYVAIFGVPADGRDGFGRRKLGTAVAGPAALQYVMITG